ncbi:dystrotelin [Peromyscus eremicus]|uniref:dystrotelin n=1 Tax=Peromyscus eremicus TaxID=42410 RepID=UPI0027DD73E8|nr:dystrotelin [Peromyscus eremicus]
MDPSEQGALNRIEKSVYRTAFKLRSMQTLCQLDLVDSSLIQQVLLRGRFGEGMETSLSMQQLFQELQELFRRTGIGNPAQARSRAPELTLSLLAAMYDSTGSGILKLRPVAAALVALSGDSPLTKYRAFFQLYAENNRRGDDSRARMTRRVLRALLTDLQQIPTVVGESCALCPVESAIHSCFRGVLSSGIKEGKFLSWVQSEPLILLWLPTCYRLSASETVTHPVRCGVCRTFPIIGLRYRCLKCLNFDICQLCFVSGLHSKSHQKSHTVMEDCVQISAKENTKLLLRSLRNSLPQRCDRIGAGRRQWLLDQLAPRDTATHAQARLSIEYKGSKAPVYVRPSGAVEAAATECPRYLSPQANDNPHHQTTVSIKKKLWKTHDSINALHRERRLLRKQLNRYRHKLQGTYTLQKEENCRFERKIRELATNQDKLWTKLQQMRQDLQAILRPLHPSSSSQNTASKIDDSLHSDGLWRVGDSSHIKSVIRYGPEWELLPNSAKADRNHKRQTSSGKALPDSEPPGTILQSTRTQGHPQERLKEVSTAPSACPQPSVDMELYGRAEQVCRAFSALVDQITLPSSEEQVRLRGPWIPLLVPGSAMVLQLLALLEKIVFTELKYQSRTYRFSLSKCRSLAIQVKFLEGGGAIRGAEVGVSWGLR